LPIKSAITSISNYSSSNSSNSNDKGSKTISVEGYAYSGGGREILRVDVSIDGGRTWDQAQLNGDGMTGSEAWRYDVGKTAVLDKATNARK
jgi:sulfite oxidase